MAKAKSKQPQPPTHELKIVVDEYEVEDDKKQVTEQVAVLWFNDDGTFAGGKVTRNTVALKGDSLKVFALNRDDDES